MLGGFFFFFFFFLGQLTCGCDVWTHDKWSMTRNSGMGIGLKGVFHFEIFRVRVGIRDRVFASRLRSFWPYTAHTDRHSKSSPQ